MLQSVEEQEPINVNQQLLYSTEISSLHDEECIRKYLNTHEKRRWDFWIYSSFDPVCQFSYSLTFLSCCCLKFQNILHLPHFTIHPSQCSAVAEEMLSVLNNSRAQSGWLSVQLWGTAWDLSRKQHNCHVSSPRKQKINTEFDSRADRRPLDTGE